MKSPPADIFIWGVHPETTVDDIVNDLAESSIIVQPKDIVKKSKDGTALNSFRISVPAVDLQKALNPDIWPLRVKVREYVYYPRKTKPTDSTKTDSENASLQHQQVQTTEMQTGQIPTVNGGSTVQKQTEQTQGVPVSNRYDLLSNDDCSGTLP